MQKSLFVIVGPTGIGKTALSIELAKHFKTEIISADSRQIYRELSIGTATPKPQELHTVKHHLVSTNSIFDYYNASMFEKDVTNLLDTLHKSHNTIILTGGSMLYIDAVCNGIDDLPTIDEDVRNNVISNFEKYGINHLRLELKRVDPEYYAKTDLKNHKRLMHAIEVFRMTGKPYSSFLTKKKKERPFNIVKIGLNIDRSILHERINKRVDLMIEEGLIEEARSVYPYRKLNSLNTVGYKELFAYFDGNIPKEEAIELIKRNSRRYARRQLTWFRKDKDIHWFEPGESEKIMNFLNEI